MYKIMIADDEEVECRTLEHKIKNMDLEITILPSACDGVSLVKNVERYRPDIAIVDINMPGLSGLESIEVLQMKKIVEVLQKMDLLLTVRGETLSLEQFAEFTNFLIENR